MALKKSSLRSMLSEGDGLKSAVQDSYASKDYGNFKGIFEPSKVSGMKFWKPQTGEHCIDILPYLAGKYNPRRPAGKAAYFVDVFVHRNVGPNDDQYICLAKSFNEHCPICEFRSERAKDPDATEEEIKSLKPSRRAIYAIWDGNDQRAGVQIWEVAHWFMENPIQAIAKKPKGGGHVDFPHPDHGKSVAFEIAAMGKNKDYKGHQFVDRDEGIPDEILEAVPVLDELLHIPTYDEVHAAFFGASASDLSGADDKGFEEEEPDPEQEEVAEEPEMDPEPEPEPEPEKPKSETGPKKRSLKVVEKEEEKQELVCEFQEFGIQFGSGEHAGQYSECESCAIAKECKEAAGVK